MKTLTDLQLDLVEEKKANKDKYGIYTTDSIMKQIKELEDIRILEKMLEEMAGMPREEMGKRQPGERCKDEL